MIPYHDGDTFTRNGLNFRVEFDYDDTSDAPWEREEGHGPVSDWTRRDKLPGERVLHEDRGDRRFYDFAEAMKIAKREGWGLGPDALAALRERLGREPTQGEIRAVAVERDFERLRAWCNNEWGYVGVVVELLDVDGDGTGETESLWGIESDAGEYLSEVAHEQADEISARMGRRKYLPRERIRIR